MSKETWDFTLLDTGFFRSGQPFHAGEGHCRITSHFPPPMSTLQGAIRSTLAAACGWQPGLNWPKKLGDANSLGSLSLQGPYLVLGETPLFPAPLNLLIKELPGTNTGGKPDIDTTFLVPGERYNCDLGSEVSLPKKKKELSGAHLPQNLYVTPEGYAAISKMEGPHKNDLYFKDNLWREESRIGLRINTKTRTAEESNLYLIGHIRTIQSLKVRVVVSGLPSDWPEIAQRTVPFGGEGRLSALEVAPFNNIVNFLPRLPELKTMEDGNIPYTISLITPLPANNRDKMKQLIIEGPVDVPGCCISACIGKTQLYGGWDLEKQKPRPLQPYLPPGSTWFFKADESERKNIEKLHGNQIGKDKSGYGYGQILIGTWEVD